MHVSLIVPLVTAAVAVLLLAAVALYGRRRLRIRRRWQGAWEELVRRRLNWTVNSTRSTGA